MKNNSVKKIVTWEQRKLGELANIVRGASPRPIQDPIWFDSNSDVGWLRISDVTSQNGRIKYLEQRISKAGQSKTRVVIEPHLLLSIAASVGKPVINYIKTGVHDGFLIFMNPKFDIEFLYQFLDSNSIDWNKYGQPGSQVNLNSEIVKSKSIYTPSLPEQSKIGNLFKTIDDTIALHNRKCNQLTQLKSTLLSKLFPKNGASVPEIRFTNFKENWEQRKLSDITNRFDNLRVPITSSKRTSGSTPYYGANGIQDFVEGYTHDGEFVLVAEDGANDLCNYPVFLVKGKIWVNNHAHVLQAIDKKSKNNFISICIKSINIEPYLVGGGRAKLNAHVMMKLKISLPCIEEQSKIGDLFKILDETITLHKITLDELITLKKSLLNKLFI